MYGHSVDLLFFLDMILSFDTAYWDDGNIITKRRESRLCMCTAVIKVQPPAYIADAKHEAAAVMFFTPGADHRPYPHSDDQ